MGILTRNILNVRQNLRGFTFHGLFGCSPIHQSLQLSHRRNIKDNKMDSELQDIFKGFPTGPLCQYRKKASFNWKDMALLMQGKDALILKVFKNISNTVLHLLTV